jgi:predicted PhzF superfamily epimerase YddE/YHI9
VLFATRFRGPLTVGRNGDWLSMEFPALAAKACTPPPELLKTLGPSVTSADVVEVFEGSESYVTVLSSANKIQGFQPDFARLEQLHPHVVVLTAPSEEVDFVSRYFAPGYGIPEDFVTGSSHCLLAPIWAHRLGKASLRARQLSPRPGELRCEVADDRVILQGKAVPVMRGSLTI